MSNGFDSRLHHNRGKRENSTRKEYKDSAKPESVSDKRGGGSLDQAAKSDHKHIAEVQRVA